MPILDTKHLRPITNPQDLNQIGESLSWAIRHQSKPRQPLVITLFKLAEWLAVPVTNADFATPIFQERLQKTLSSRKYCDLYALLLGNKQFFAYAVPVTLDGLYEFRHEMGAFYCALFAGVPEPDFAIISIESEFYVIVGKADFVNQILDCEIQAAFLRFQNFVMNETPGVFKENLNLVYNQLKDNYQSAEVGAVFRLSP